MSSSSLFSGVTPVQDSRYENVTKKRRPAVTFEQVSRFCDEWVQKNEAMPSVRDVVAAIGGSNGSISALLETYRLQKPIVTAAALITLDPQISTILSRQIEIAVTDAIKKSTDDLKRAQDDLSEVTRSSNQLQSELDENQLRIEQLEEELQREKGISQAKSEAADQAQKSALETIELIKKEHFTALDAIKREAAEAVKKAEDSAFQERQKNDEVSKLLGAAQQQANEVEPLRANLSSTQKTLEEIRTVAVEAQVQLASTKAAAESATARVEVLEKDLAQTREKLSSADVKAARSEAQAEERTMQINELHARVKMLTDLQKVGPLPEETGAKAAGDQTAAK